MRHSPHLTVLLALLALALPACGGGGGDDQEDIEIVEVLAPGDPDLDGFAVKRGGAILGNSIAAPAAGDLKHPNGQQTYRGIFSFDLPVLPAGARIVSVELSVHQRSVSGDPMGLMGQIVVDHIAMGATFDVAAYDAFTLEEIRDANGQRVALSTVASTGRRSIDVTAQVEADLAAGRVRSQYRVRGEFDTPDGDDVADLISFSDSEQANANVPMLIIRYEQP